MAEPVARRRWWGRAMFVALSLLVILAHLIPLETVPPALGGLSIEPIEAIGLQPNADAALLPDDDLLPRDPVRWIAPDLLLLLALAWVARRPSLVPALAVAAVFLLADFLFQKPPGLWAGLVLILSEIIRNRAYTLRTLPFWIEWATVASGIAVITFIERFTLSMVLVPQAPLGLTLVQLTLTIIAYPLVVFVSYVLFGVNRPAPGEVDAFGHRL